MATKAKSARGTKLKRGDAGSPEVFTLIAEVKDIKGPSETAADFEVTSYDSTAKEFLTDLPDNGELTFDMNFIGSDTEQQGLRTDLRAGTTRNFQLVFNDHSTSPTTASFAAQVTKLENTAPMTNAYAMSCALKISGTVTWVYRPN